MKTQFLLLALLASGARAQFPTSFDFQGRLIDGSQALTGLVTLTARLHTDSTTGTAILTETDVVTVDEHGRFFVTLGDQSPITPVGFDGPLWLGLTVDEAGGGSEIIPRTPVQPVPQSLRAHRAETLMTRVIHVDHSGDDVESGSRLISVIDAIPTHVSTMPYVVKVGPGRFDLGALGLDLGNDLTLQGSGQQLTTLVSSNAIRVLSPDDRTVIQDLRVESVSRAIDNQLGLDVVVRDVEIVVAGAGSVVKTGIQAFSKPITIERVRIEVTGELGDQIQGIKIVYLTATPSTEYAIRDSIVIVHGNNPSVGNAVYGVQFSVTGSPPLQLERTRIEVDNLPGRAEAIWTNDSGADIRQCEVMAAGTGFVYSFSATSAATIRVVQSQYMDLLSATGTICGRGNADLAFNVLTNVACP